MQFVYYYSHMYQSFNNLIQRLQYYNILEVALIKMNIENINEKYYRLDKPAAV
jgi:hypothetical protein